MYEYKWFWDDIRFHLTYISHVIWIDMGILDRGRIGIICALECLYWMNFVIYDQ